MGAAEHPAAPYRHSRVSGNPEPFPTTYPLILNLLKDGNNSRERGGMDGCYCPRGPRRPKARIMAAPLQLQQAADIVQKLLPFPAIVEHFGQVEIGIDYPVAGNAAAHFRGYAAG